MSRGSILGVMLYIPPTGDLDAQSGTWSRSELLEQNDRFVAAVERAFANGLESRSAARATYAVNGKRRLTVDAVVEAAWCWFKDDAKFEATAVEVLARCPGITPECVREGIKRRFVSWIGAAR